MRRSIFVVCFVALLVSVGCSSPTAPSTSGQGIVSSITLDSLEVQGVAPPSDTVVHYNQPEISAQFTYAVTPNVWAGLKRPVVGACVGNEPDRAIFPTCRGFGVGSPEGFAAVSPVIDSAYSISSTKYVLMFVADGEKNFAPPEGSNWMSAPVPGVLVKSIPARYVYTVD